MAVVVTDHRESAAIQKQLARQESSSVQLITPDASPSPTESVVISSSSPVISPSPNSQSSMATVTWEFDGSAYRASSTAPACPSPFTFRTPVDLSAVTSILYPGQTRGGDYKPHGGFRFDNSTDGAVTVRAPYDAHIVAASRYIESGEVQYMFEFQHNCGIVYRFDHLKTLSPALQAVANALPEAKVDDSRTTSINPPVPVSAGDTLSTKVGISDNVFVDWGAYDLRKTNGITKSGNSLASYSLCWFDWISSADAAAVRALPATADNKTSDYCK